MILAHQLTKRFDDFVAVNQVSLDVPAGQVMILLGPNGAGKTTTVRMLTSILRPSAGWAKVGGYDVVQEAAKVRASVGVLTEHHGLYGRMNALEYLYFYGQLYNMPSANIRKRSHDLLEQFGLGDVGKKRLGEYSKGMRQKLALVRALLHDPDVLLLDEPTSAMDPESARLVRDAIHSLRDGNRTILLCTHNLVEAEELADQVAIIRRGQVIFSHTLKGLKYELLGAPEYELRLAGKLNGTMPVLPQGVEMVSTGEDWLRFRIQNPEESNPVLLRNMLDAHMQVISLHEVPQTLEEAYLEANNRAALKEQADHD